MIEVYDKLFKDFERVNKIAIVQTMLEVICQTTGMGFAAVARVTEERWLACSVRDKIGFGLKPGEELPLETTLCHEVKNQGAEIIIDNLAEDDVYCNHHSPKLYGYKSYISYPIILKNGEFFGTLCAIDPQPAHLRNDKITNTFLLFADLLSFHLQSVELMERNHSAFRETCRQLQFSQDENKQYQHISTHTLKEPLRKIQMYSDRLVNDVNGALPAPAKETVQKIQSMALDLSRKLQDIGELADLNAPADAYKTVKLNQIIEEVANHLHINEGKKLLLSAGNLPEIMAVPSQIKLLFYHLLLNAIQFAKRGTEAEIKITLLSSDAESVKLSVTYMGIGLEEFRLKDILDLFKKPDPEYIVEGLGTGLPTCRKIVSLHGGHISAAYDAVAGTVFTIALPTRRNVVAS